MADVLPPGVTLEPIDGGPSYYADNGFTYAAKAGWDSPNYVPVGPWLDMLVTQSDASRWVDLGWNTAYTLTSNSDITLAASNNISVLQNGGGSLMPGSGAETVGLLTQDEPSTFAEGVSTPIGTTPNSIQDGRFWFVNNTWNFVAYGGLNGTPAPGDSATVLDTPVATPNGTTRHIDASSIDLYWFAGARSGAAVHEGGILDNLGQDMTADQAARGSNYGDMISNERAATGGHTPILGFVEDGGPYLQDTAASDYITPPELNWATWSSLIHGARGIEYFNHSFAGPAQTDDNLADAYYQAVQPGQTVSMYNQVKSTDALVEQMAPVLNSPNALGYVTVNTPGYVDGVVDSTFSGIEVAAKDDNGQFYLITDTRDSEGATNINATFTLADTNATSVTVIGENRSIAVANGVFSDAYAHGSTVHIYEVNDAGGPPPPPPPPPGAPAVAITSADATVTVAAQTITGTVDTADIGSTVHVFDGTTAVGTAIVAPDGSWSDAVTLNTGVNVFTATDTNSGGTGTSNAVTLTLAPPPPPPPTNLVTNGSFETGTFSGWTQGGNHAVVGAGPQLSVQSGHAEDGNYSVEFGSIGKDATLSQKIATVAGHTYEVDFWLQNEANGTPTDFHASFGNAHLTSLINGPSSGYTQYDYNVTASAASTALKFAAANGPAQWDLDNVSVVDVTGLAGHVDRLHG